MASQLQANLNTILQEKTDKMIPENIKKDVQIFNIVGTLEELAGEEITITPGIKEQVITPIEGKNGITKATVSAVTSRIDVNITPENIKKDISILGVTGTLEGGIDTSDATATVSDIAKGATAYVNGEKITGTVKEYTSEHNDIASNESVSSILNSPIVEEVYTNSEGETFVSIRYVIDSIYRADSRLGVDATALVKVIGLTADKIKSGETILGITGTYTGETTSDEE